MSIQVSDETADGAGAPLRPVVVNVAAFALDQLRIHPDSELSVVFVDDAAMEQLHQEWMDLPGPTDVLSFPMDEMVPTPEGEEPHPGMLGDLVLAPHFVARQAAEHGATVEAEVELLTVHGILHLVGFDHAEPHEERAMFARQATMLDDLRSLPVRTSGVEA